VSRIAILGIRLDAQRYEPAIEALLKAARSSEARRAHFATVHSVVEATGSAEVREAFATAWMVCTDGLPLAWVARIRGNPAERVCGPDVMLTLCDRGRGPGLRHYFLGGGPGTAERLALRLASRFEGLQVAGTASPPFRDLTDAEDQAIVDAINSATPHVVWIGLGSPKQDLWAASHASRLRCGLVLPVGAAFDFHSGRLRRAPSWIRRLGLEWLFRLAMEPRRLLRRYVITNTRFIVLVAREEFARRRHRSDGRS
jgi:N-acetylglucosaminyldiphosphoundecaprenol N-acetyl-beta-D-mannosaminyltransferase